MKADSAEMAAYLKRVKAKIEAKKPQVTMVNMDLGGLNPQSETLGQDKMPTVLFRRVPVIWVDVLPELEAAPDGEAFQVDTTVTVAKSFMDRLCVSIEWE